MVLGVLLSALGAWYFRTKYSIYDRLYPWYTKKQLAEFPMIEENARFEPLVDRMLSLHKRLAQSPTPQEKKLLQQQIEITDRQIDQLVYQLYGLTDQEIKIVEESTTKIVEK